jgi:plasmid stabilization system protein ParE
MEKKKVIWTRKAEIQMYVIMDYYVDRNKSDSYSLKLQSDIKQKLRKLDFTTTLPKKSSIKDLFYFIHNHISVFFLVHKEHIVVILVWDERRNPNDLNLLLQDL